MAKMIRFPKAFIIIEMADISKYVWNLLPFSFNIYYKKKNCHKTAPDKAMNAESKYLPVCSGVKYTGVN